MSRRVTALLATTVLLAGLAVPAAADPAPHYDHVFVVVEENHGFPDVVGDPAAPNFNALASQYGLATNYFAVSHPSEPNYVALLGGGTFGVADDNPYYVNRVDQQSLVSQLDHAGLPWHAYLQGLPHPGYQGICYPANCNGAPDKDPLYVSKHDGIQNYTTSLNPADWSRQVPIGQLAGDLRRGNVPAFNWVIPDECHDQHGDPPYCIDSGNPGDPQDQHLVATGDAYLGQLVATITGAPFWSQGNNAIVVTYDEGDDNTGGGGKVATVVVTSHGPRHVQDATAYNHYSTLATIQRNFGLGCLANSCGATPLDKLFAVTGAPAAAWKPLPVPDLPTPTPTPAEPVSYVTNLPSSAGWTVAAAPKLGTSDNTYGAVAAVSPRNVWAVGNFLPDTATSNQDATLSLAAHFDGTKWTSTPTPNSGPNYNTLFGVAATADKAWGVGVAVDDKYNAHSLIETWNGTAWQVTTPPCLGSQRDWLFSAAAVSDHDVWAVGARQDWAGRFTTLVEHWDGRAWTVVPSPNPGAAGDQFFGVAADGPNDVWAVGQRNDVNADRPLVEHWDGYRWSPVATGTAAGLLNAVAVRNGQVWAVGQTDDATDAARGLVVHNAGRAWTSTVLTGVGTAFTDLTGAAIADDGPWAVGTYYDSTAGRQQTLVLHGDSVVAAPSPGTGDAVLGGISAAGRDVWASGFDKTDSGRDPLIMRRP